MKLHSVFFPMMFVTVGMLLVSCSDPSVNSTNSDTAKNLEPEASVKELTEEEKRAKVEAISAEAFAQSVLEEDNRRKEAEALAAKEAEEYAAKRKAESARVAKIRDRVVGKEFVSLTLAGRTFEGVTVTEINDREIRLTHASGISNIAWDQVKQKVKEQWGFDEGAFEEIQEQEALALAKQEAYLNSPEGIQAKKDAEAARRQKERAEIEKEKLAITEKIRELRDQISKGNAAIRTLESNKYELTKSYRSEDSNAARIKRTRNDLIYGNEKIGGVSTSKADRARALEKIEVQIRAAKAAIESIRDKIKAEEKKLRAVASAT